MKAFTRAGFILLACCLVFTTTACRSSDADAAEGTTGGARVTTIVPAEDSEMFTKRDGVTDYDTEDAVTIDLADDATYTDDPRVTVAGNCITLTGAGTYLLRGTLTDGRLCVDASDNDKLHIVFDGVSVSTSKASAFCIQHADKVFLTLAEGTSNSLTASGEAIADGSSNVDATVFSKCDLTVNGSGQLTVLSEASHGFAVKADLVLMGGTLTVTGAKHAISAKKSVRIKNGTYLLTAGTDGIHAEDQDDAARGFVHIAGGTLSINANADGLDAATTIQLIGGSITVATTNGKGIKAGMDLLIACDTLDISSADDAIHTNACCSITQGNIRIRTGDDGVHADDNLTIHGGTIEIGNSYEGLEGNSVDVLGGDITIKASDDGINAAGGTDASGFAPPNMSPGRREDTFGETTDESTYICVAGGRISVDAGGDGLDSNGSITVTGGTLFVSGSTGSDDAALDYDGNATVTGGVIVMTGSRGMAQNFGNASTQGSILLNYAANAESTVVLQSEAGDSLLTYEPPKAYSSVLVSHPSLSVGDTYSLTAAGTTQSIKLTSLIYGSGGMGGGMGGGRPMPRF